MTFPELEAAIAGIEPGDVAEGPSYRLAIAAYATDLLPALLGSTWAHHPRAWVGSIMPGRLTPDMFDHAQVFRPVGCRGKLIWRSAAVIGMPYGGLQEDGTVSSGTAAEAAELRTSGVETWIRRDLSAWYPGWTQLVISAPGLGQCDPAQFGFVRA